jgi:ribosomal protein L7/L12
MFAEAPALQPAPATPEEEAKKIRIPLFEETMPIWAKVGKYDVELQVVGERTQEVIKVVGSFAGLNEKFVARMLQDLPATVLRRANDERALQAKKDLEAVGATVKLVEKKIPDRSHAPAKPAGSGSAQKMHPPGGPAGSATSRQAPVKSPPPAPGAK